VCFHLAKNILPAPRAQINRARKLNRTPHLHPRGTWTIETLEEAMDIIKKRAFSNEKGQLVLAHTSNFSFKPFEWQDKIEESSTTRYINE
jgi:hypothetical protein